MAEVVAAVDNLIRQATEERSHYYAGKILRLARATIITLEQGLALKDDELSRLKAKWGKRPPPRRYVLEKERVAILADYSQGKSWEQIVRKYRRDRRTIRKILDEAGVEKRNPDYVPKFVKKVDLDD